MIALIVASLIGEAVALRAQELDLDYVPPRWSLAGGATTQRINDLGQDWGIGPTLIITHIPGKWTGIEAAASYLISNDGITAIAADLGGLFCVSWDERNDLFFSAGGSLVIGDSESSPSILASAYLAARAQHQLYGPLSFFVRGAVRVYQTGEAGPSGGAGLHFRW